MVHQRNALANFVRWHATGPSVEGFSSLAVHHVLGGYRTFGTGLRYDTSPLKGFTFVNRPLIDVNFLFPGGLRKKNTLLGIDFR
jgi:hypothetical protein